jgi:hypothetical protein
VQVTSFTGTQVTLTSSLHGYTRPLVASYSKPDPGEPFDVTPVVCHGGLARVTWYMGYLEPMGKKKGIHLSVLMDGRVISTMLRGSVNGVWEDDPATIEAVVRCPRGRRVFAATVAS